MNDGLVVGEDGLARCFWGAASDEYRAYHDGEWGFPVTDDRRLFEKLCLEGFQAGLSWLTILRKREAFRRAFADFDFDAVARFGPRDVERLLADASIVRHRGKIESTINNAAPVRRAGRGGGLARGVRVALRAGSADAAEAADPGCAGRDGADRGVEGAGEGSEEAWLDDSSGRRPSTRSCRRWVSSTTTSTAALSATRRKERDEADRTTGRWVSTTRLDGCALRNEAERRAEADRTTRLSGRARAPRGWVWSTITSTAAPYATRRKGAPRLIGRPGPLGQGQAPNRAT